MEHAWCHDTARDAAVRAAEDGRPGPLPTLEQCIAMLPKSGSASSAVEQENNGVRMTKSDRQAADYRAEAIARPFADAAERSSTVSKTGEGQSGLREQRVSLSLKWMGELISERDAAIRERDALQAQVAALTIKLEAASGGGWHTVTEGDCLSTVRDAGGRPMPKGPAPGLVAKQAASGVILDSDDVFQRLHNWRQRWSSNHDGDRCGLDDFLGAEILEDLVDYVCEIRAASGGGEGEPVAWMCEWTDHTSLYDSRTQAEIDSGGDIVPQPLYRQPPQPRGWLTEEEIKSINWLLDNHGKCVVVGTDSYYRENIAKLLARSSPPEVVLPTVFSISLLGDRLLVEAQVKEALAASGVAVKEVGRE
jgi:hypothetical protein